MIDHVRGAPDVLVAEVVGEEAAVAATVEVDEDVDELDDLPQPDSAQATATSPTTAQPRRRLLTARV
jgi:hypothetical protein